MKTAVQTIVRTARAKRSLILVLGALSALSCSGDNLLIDLPDRWSSSPVVGQSGISDEDLERFNAESNFSVARQIANEYLVLTVVVTESEVKPIKSHLVRGPEKANSPTGDLEIRALSRGKAVMSYTVANPRLTKQEGVNWAVSKSAQMVIFVPLQSTLDSVQILPVPRQQFTISGIVEFDPWPWANSACNNNDEQNDHREEKRVFAACPAIQALAPARLRRVDPDTLE